MSGARRGAVGTFSRTPTGKLAGGAVLVLALVAFLGPILWEEAARAGDVLHAGEGPSPDHLLGTDLLGRDLLFRTLAATRFSLGLALAAALAATLIGFPIGALVSLLGPRWRELGARAIDTVLGFPDILLAIFVVAIIGPSPRGAVIATGVALAPGFARLASTLASSVAGQEYFAAARITGVRTHRLLLRYTWPNIAETVWLTSVGAVASSLVAIASLSFLGLGVQPPDYDWGRMLVEGIQAFYVTPIAALAPAFMIAATGLSLGFLGEALARASNPRLWTAQQAAVRGGARALMLPPGRGERATRGSGEALGEALLSVDSLTVSLPTSQGDALLVADLSFEIGRGEIVGVVGESGSGKTLTALALAQLVPHPLQVSAKSLTFLGTDLLHAPAGRLQKLLGTRMAMVFQDPMSSLHPALRIGLQLTEASEVHGSVPRSAALRVARERLEEVHVSRPDLRLRQYPHELSGGMRQRAMIAMGLMGDPALIIADEPTTALDVTVQAQVMAVLQEANRKYGAAILLISHNAALVAQVCDRILVMYAGRIVEDIAAARLADAAHPYTRALIAAVPDIDADRGLPLTDIPGRLPDVRALPPGCAYAPRCPVAVARCGVERPPLDTLEEGHRAACWVASAEYLDRGRPVAGRT